MTTTVADIDVRPLQPDDRAQVVGLLTATLAGGPSGERSTALFAWKHEHNPFGPSIALVAVSGDRIVGLRTFMRWRFVSGQRRIRAVRAVDTATHPDWQGRGIFTRLTRAALTEAAADAVEFVFNTPNARAGLGT